MKTTASLNLLSRFWIYQAERFPIFSHGLLIAAFSFSAVSFSQLGRGVVTWPGPATLLVAFSVAFLFFLQLRIADEFKDFAEDQRYRPYRPVPRGLVSLAELGRLAAVSAGLQLVLAWWLAPALLWLLLLAWLYLALMSKEFFVSDWLKARPLTYLWSHMLIVPLIDLFTTACDWLVAGAGPPHWALLWFLLVSYCNGTIIELGRKIRAPADEEVGVASYTALWGVNRALLAWSGAVLLTAACAWLVSRQIGFAGPAGWLLLGLSLLALLLAFRFWQRPLSRRAQQLETMSGVWTVLMYLGIGLGPLLWRLGFG
jgi:4-hydroxybenzoate polyprenyltransferase